MTWLYLLNKKTGERVAVRAADYRTKHIGVTGQTYEDLGFTLDPDVGGQELPKAHADKPAKKDGD